MAIHVTLIGPNVDSKKGNDDGKSGDNGPWQKDHQATSTISGGSAPEGAQMSANWTKLDLGQMNFDVDQLHTAREIIIWGDSVNDAISELCFTRQFATKTEYYGNWRYPVDEWYKDIHRENCPLMQCSAFANNPKLKNITFYVPVYKIGDELFKGWSRSTPLSMTLVGGFIEVGKEAFRDCSDALELMVLEPTVAENNYVAIGARPDYYDEMPPEWVQWIGSCLYAAVKTIAIAVVAVTAIVTAVAISGLIGGLMAGVTCLFPSAVAVSGGTMPVGAHLVTQVGLSLLATSSVLTYTCAQLGDTWSGAVANVRKSHFKFDVDDGKDYDYYVIDKQIQIGNTHCWWSSGRYAVKLGEKSFYNCSNTTIKDLLFGNGEYLPGKNNEAMANYATNAYMTKESPARNNTFNSHGFSLATLDEVFYWHGREWAWAASQWNSTSPVMDEDTQLKMLAVLNWSPKESSYRGIVRGLVSDMGKRAFYNASIVPEVLHLHCNVGESCFRANEKIRAVIFTSGSNLSIGETAFYGCKKLSHVDFGGHVRTIGAEAFYNTIITTKKYIAENIPEKITISATEEYTIDHSLLYSQGSNFLCSNLAKLKEFIEAGNTDKIEFLCKYGSSAREYMLNKTYYEYDNLILLAAEKSEKEIDKAERNKYILSAMKHRGFEHYLQIPIMEDFINDTEFWSDSELSRYWAEYIEGAAEEPPPTPLDVVLAWMEGEYYSDSMLIDRRNAWFTKDFCEVLGYDPDALSTAQQETISVLLEEGGLLKWQDVELMRWLIEKSKSNNNIDIAALRAQWTKKSSSWMNQMLFKELRKAFIEAALFTPLGTLLSGTKHTYGLGLQGPLTAQQSLWVNMNFTSAESFYNFLCLQNFFTNTNYSEEINQLLEYHNADSLLSFVLTKYWNVINWLDEYSCDAISFREPLTDLLDLSSVYSIGEYAFKNNVQIGALTFGTNENAVIAEIHEGAFYMGDSTGVGIAHNAFGIIGELEFPATFTYLGDMAFAENECLTSVIFNNKVSAGYYGTNDDDTSDVLVNHWATYPPFRNCPVTHWQIWADNLEPVTDTENNRITYLYAFAKVYADDTPYLVNTKCTHLTIAGTEVAGYKLSTNARMPKTVQELILNVPVGFDEKLFLWSDDLQRCCFEAISTWAQTWGASHPIKYATALPFHHYGVQEQSRGEYIVEGKALFDYEIDGELQKIDYNVNEMLSEKLTTFKDCLGPEAFFGAKPFYTLTYTRDDERIPILGYRDIWHAGLRIQTKWPCVDFVVTKTGYKPPLSENALAIPLLDGYKTLANYFDTERFASIKILSLPRIFACNTTGQCLFKGLVNELSIGSKDSPDDYKFATYPIKLYLPDDICFIQDGAIGPDMNLFIYDFSHSSHQHSFDNLIYNNDIGFYQNVTNIKQYDLSKQDDYTALYTSLTNASLWTDFERKMKNQAILTYFNNTKHNLLLKWESLEGADHVATTYLTPDVKVVTSQALNLKYVVVPSKGESGQALLIKNQQCYDSNNEPIIIKNNIENIVITFDFAFLGASASAQAAATKYSYLSYILDTDTKLYYIRIDGLTINIIYTQNFDLKTYANADNEHRPLGGVPHIETFIFRDPPKTYIEEKGSDWVPTVKINGPFLEDGATIKNLVLVTRKLPVNFLKFETNVKQLNVLDCEFLWDDTADASINKAMGEGWFPAYALAPVEKIEHFVCPKNFTSIDNGCWNSNLLINNCYYHAPLYYWGFELKFTTYLENPLGKIVHFYSNETLDSNERKIPTRNYSDYTINWNITSDVIFEKCKTPTTTYGVGYTKNLSKLDYSRLTLPSGETGIALNKAAYYDNWFINSVMFDNRITAIGAKAFDNSHALREMLAQDKKQLFALFSNGLSKAYFSNVLNFNIIEMTDTEKTYVKED